MILVSGVSKSYKGVNRSLEVLSDIQMEIAEGEFLAITGPSGSGKSTLLGLLAGLDRPDAGSIRIGQTDLTNLDESQLSILRGEKIGFVFQNFQLIPTLTALENVRIPAEIAGNTKKAAQAEDILKRVGLSHRTGHYPNQLSGGEMQRVAIARASIMNPAVLFADEPTGNLDSKSGQDVMDLLIELNQNCTLVMVTHNPQLARLADREVKLKDGRIESVIQHKKNAGGSRKKTAKKKRAKKKAGAR